MAKLKGSETYVNAARLGMQVLAGHGRFLIAVDAGSKTSAATSPAADATAAAENSQT